MHIILCDGIDFIVDLWYNKNVGTTRLTIIVLGFAQKGGNAMSENTCKVVLALIGLASAAVAAYKEIRMAEIASEKK